MSPDLKHQNSGFHGFVNDYRLRHKYMSFTKWRHATIVMQSRQRVW